MTWRISIFMCFYKGDISKSSVHWQIVAGLKLCENWAVGSSCTTAFTHVFPVIKGGKGTGWYWMEKVHHSSDGVGALGTRVCQELALECRFNCTVCSPWKAAHWNAIHGRSSLSVQRFQGWDRRLTWNVSENLLLCLQLGSWEGSRAATYPPTHGTSG